MKNGRKEWIKKEQIILHDNREYILYKSLFITFLNNINRTLIKKNDI